MSDGGQRRCRLIAVCGVDGVGKSTLLSRLIQEDCSKALLAPVKMSHRDSDLMVQLRNTCETTPPSRDFYRMNALACAFDYRAHFEAEVRPLLKLTGVVFCDRYTPCYVANGLMSQMRPEVEYVLRDLPRPDYVIYVHAPLATVLERQLLKEEPDHRTQEFAAAYETILKELPNVHHVLNDCDIATGLQRLRRSLAVMQLKPVLEP